MSELVLLAGMNCSAQLWSGTGLDAITPDLTEPSIDGQVRVLLNELPSSFTVIGLSLGAIVAMALAIRAPERVAALCVTSTNARGPTPRQRAGWDEWVAQLDNGRTPRQLQSTILTSLLSERARREQPGLAERALEMGDSVEPVRLRAQLAMQSSRTDLRQKLRQLRMPTLVVSGSDDVICPIAYHSEIANAVPRARLVSVEGGHLLPMEDPEVFGELVRSWLAECC
jgi:pimeloyl-ACP methyl ester carboxylesterase